MTCPECDFTHAAEECGRYRIMRMRRRGKNYKGSIVVYDTATSLYAWAYRDTTGMIHLSIDEVNIVDKVLDCPARARWVVVPDDWELLDE